MGLAGVLGAPRGGQQAGGKLVRRGWSGADRVEGSSPLGSPGDQQEAGPAGPGLSQAVCWGALGRLRPSPGSDPLCSAPWGRSPFPSRSCLLGWRGGAWTDSFLTPCL